MSPGLIAGALGLFVGAPPATPDGGSPPNPPGFSEAHKTALARYGAGIWQARRSRLLSAAKSLEAAAEQDPDATAPLKDLVRIYSQIGREPDAIRVARIVLEKDPHDADTAHALARLLFDAGELTEAIGLAKLAADKVDALDHPDKALAVYRDLATLLDKAGDPAGAAGALQKAAELLTAKRKVVVASGTLTPKEIDAEAADTFERLGKMLVKGGKPDAAAEAFRSAHKLYADPARVNDPTAAARLDWNLSAALAAKGDPAAARTHLEAFLKLQPQAVEPYDQLVALLNQSGRGGEAVPALQRYAARDPKNLPLQAVLASELARDPGTRREADAYFSQLYAATNDPKVVRAVIRSHVETGRAGQVIADADRAFQVLKDDDARADERRAFAAEKARVIADVLRAEPDWANAVLRAASDDVRAGTRRVHQTWHLLGLLAARHGKLDLAAVQFQQAVRNAPKETQTEAYVGLIDVLQRSHKPAEVVAVCRDGLRTAEWVAPVVFNFHLAYALAELGEADEAVATADKAIAQAGDTDRLTVRLRKVAVLQALGRWDDAAGLCKKLLDEFDAPADRARVRYTLAVVYGGAKKYPEAEAELRTVLDADPDHTGACNDLGYHLAEQGRNLDEAERLVRHALAVDRADRGKAGDPEPESAAYLDSLAWVLFRKGKLAEAKDLLERVVRTSAGSSDPVVWDHLGDVQFRLGEKAKAKTAWDRAADLFATGSRGKRDGRLDEVKRKLKRVP
ncbi:MAG: tetratricopeptide repeat protein [Gemmataceae bacterium]|nr:tetratricopeptide repeat protein [Gemmataceae bacterium]